MHDVLTPNAEEVVRKRYLRKDKDGNVETWEDLVNRVINYVCKIEDDNFKKKTFDLIYHTRFLPNSPCLVNSGTRVGGLLACFVTKSPEDSWEGMIENKANFGYIARRGGGCGVDFSLIRPEGDPVFGSTHAKACGPIQHMRTVSEDMSSITQAGFRGMANMGCLRVDHPDIEKFILCKQRDNALRVFLKEDIFNHYDMLKEGSHEHLNIVLDKFISNFNISVLTTNEFMSKVENDEDFDLVFNGKTYRTIKARQLFDKIIENAWRNGDPGMLFYDSMNDGPYKYSKQELTATNPCGEQCLPQYGSCNLGSIDVSKFFDEEEKSIDWKSLRKAIHVGVQFLDNVIGINRFPTEHFAEWAKNNRPVGLGIMGWADLLLKMRLTYGSVKSLEVADSLAVFFKLESHRKSVELGKLRGTPKCCKYDELDHRRNVTTISIAPTGTISQIAGCNSSIEPWFSPVVFRYDNTTDGEARISTHQDAAKSYFKCAVNHDDPSKEVSWQQHVDMQAVFQAQCDSGISKTINMRNSATIEDVESAYIRAWKKGCKGITIYRDGCKTTQVLNTTQKIAMGSSNAPPRPKSVPCDIHKTKAEGFDWHILVGLNLDIPYELFAVNGRVNLPKTGSIVKRKKRYYSLLDDDENVLIENLAEEEKKIDKKISLETRRFSLEMRHGIPIKYIVDQIDKSSEALSSFSKATARIMKSKYMSAEDHISIADDVACPSCAKEGKKTEMSPEAGCWKCPECAYAACG